RPGPRWFPALLRNRWSLVTPALVGRRDLRALVLDRHAAQRIVLALGEAVPVVRHENAGEARMSVEDDAEHVVGLPLLPVGGRVDRGDAGQVRILGGDAAFEAE